MIYESQSERFTTGEARHVHRWIPDVSPWSLLVIVHGLGDHGGRYARMAQWFVNCGVVVQAVDLVGHGQSPGQRGCIRDYESLLGEVTQSVRLARSTWPTLDCFLFGQSMGGNLVLNWALRQPHDVNGAIVSAPVLRPTRPPHVWLIQFLRCVNRILPNLCIKKPVKAKWLCKDQASQQAYLNDPLVHKRLSLRLGAALLDSGVWALDQAHELRLPTLLMHGSDDLITSPQASREFASRNTTHVTLRIWESLMHDLHFEPEWEEVMQVILDWMHLHEPSVWASDES